MICFPVFLQFIAEIHVYMILTLVSKNKLTIDLYMIRTFKIFESESDPKKVIGQRGTYLQFVYLKKIHLHGISIKN